jgi:2-alkyl-3-oxoalkanoate reductase
MRLLMIGGAGLVGRSVLPELVRSHGVTVLDRDRLDAPGAASIVGDARDARALTEAMADAEGVVHLAAIVPRGERADDPELIRRTFDLNVTGVYLALRAALANGIRSFVHVSTMSVFASYGRVLIDAAASPDSRQPYGLSKRLAEELCASFSRERQMTVTSLRLAYPTTEELWPLWRSPGTPDAIPARPALEDGIEFDALAPSDLARAIDAALRRRGTYAAVPVTGDADGVSFRDDRAARMLSWTPVRGR